MAKILTPRMSGTINIELSIEDAKDLADSLNVILDTASPTWVGRKIREYGDGETCNQFLQALKKTVD